MVIETIAHNQMLPRQMGTKLAWQHCSPPARTPPVSVTPHCITVARKVAALSALIALHAGVKHRPAPLLSNSREGETYADAAPANNPENTHKSYKEKIIMIFEFLHQPMEQDKEKKNINKNIPSERTGNYTNICQ